MINGRLPSIPEGIQDNEEEGTYNIKQGAGENSRQIDNDDIQETIHPEDESFRDQKNNSQRL